MPFAKLKKDDGATAHEGEAIITWTLKAKRKPTRRHIYPIYNW